MSASLVGSEMCIRDRLAPMPSYSILAAARRSPAGDHTESAEWWNLEQPREGATVYAEQRSVTCFLRHNSL
eukprot:5423070-Alexandrium_andersonii.AAC.1